MSDLKLWGFCRRKQDVGVRLHGIVLASSQKEARKKAEALLRQEQIEPRHLRARVWPVNSAEV